MPDTGIVGNQHRTQYAGEKIATWTLNVGSVGSAAGAVTNPDMRIIRRSDGVDVTATVTSGAMSVAGQIITLLTIGGNAVPPGTPQSLTEGEQYRVDVFFDKDGNVDLCVLFYIDCPDVRP